MKASLKSAIVSTTNSSDAKLVEVIQELWSGYGFIARVQLMDSKTPSVIVKNIEFPERSNHPRGWNTSASHERKVKSYEIEVEWYKMYSALCNESCRVPRSFASKMDKDDTFIILEDLDSIGYPIRKSQLNKDEAKVCLSWLANFHANFMNRRPDKLWEVGTYWHLATRSEEYQSMEESELKNNAFRIDEILNSCRFKTFVHGDAKVANFCFSEDGRSVAAVDFQYVGGGCGMKDVAYLLGSCLSESECRTWEVELLNSYFSSLKVALELNGIDGDFKAIETEWRTLYPMAWADFTRFLLGWMPSHKKLNSYSAEMVRRTLSGL